MKNTVKGYTKLAQKYGKMYNNRQYEFDGVGCTGGIPYIQIHRLSQLRALFPDAEFVKKKRENNRESMYDFEYSIVVDGVKFLTIADDTQELI